MERFIPLALIILWFGLIFLGSYLINWLLVRSIIRRYYRFFVAPGVIVHELSHAVGCLITGSPIIEINFWHPNGGHVKHLQPSDPFRRLINDPIIALAPIWGTFFTIGLLTWLNVPELLKFVSFPSWQIIFDNLDLQSLNVWIYLYLVTSLLATMAPSRTDILYALGSLIFLTCGLIIALYFLPIISEQLSQIVNHLKPFGLFSLGLICLGISVAFLLAIPARRYHFTPKESIK